MTAAQYLMLAAVIASLWLGRWNATSWILAGSYFATQAWFLVVGVVNPGDMFMLDLTAVLLIYCKAIARDERCEEYRGGWDQFICFLYAPTLCDRAILTVFPLMWLAYVLKISDHARWWSLFALAMLQFLFAGHEALTRWRQEKRARQDPDSAASGLQFAWAGAQRWST